MKREYRNERKKRSQQSWRIIWLVQPCRDHPTFPVQFTNGTRSNSILLVSVSIEARYSNFDDQWDGDHAKCHLVGINWSNFHVAFIVSFLPPCLERASKLGRWSFRRARARFREFGEKRFYADTVTRAWAGERRDTRNREILRRAPDKRERTTADEIRASLHFRLAVAPGPSMTDVNAPRAIPYLAVFTRILFGSFVTSRNNNNLFLSNLVSLCAVYAV